MSRGGMTIDEVGYVAPPDPIAMAMNAGAWEMNPILPVSVAYDQWYAQCGQLPRIS